MQLVDLAGRDLPPDDVVHDDLLRLIFTCCHPTLSATTRVALALRTLCGLSAAQIADVLLGTEAGTQKRLTRARQKITAARIPYRVPTESELPERLPAVCGVIHSLYTTGHAPLDGGAAYDLDVCAEAIRLAELLHHLLPDQPMPAAVLALLLLTHARGPARLDDHGDVVTLDRQDRDRWDAAAIARGIALLNDSLRRTHGQADAYQLQAAIAAEHARAASYDETDWVEIVRLYDVADGGRPSHAVRANCSPAKAATTTPSEPSPQPSTGRRPDRSDSTGNVAARPSSNAPPRTSPAPQTLHSLTRDLGDQIEVLVQMQDCQTGSLRQSRNQQVRHRRGTVPPLICEHQLDLDNAPLGSRGHELHGHQRQGRSPGCPAKVRTRSRREPHLQQGHGRDPQQPTPEPVHPEFRVIARRQAHQRRLVDQPGGHRHAWSVTSGSARSAKATSN